MSSRVKYPDAPTIVEVMTDIPQPWNGWRFTSSGKHLRSPDGDLITPQRLRGLLWRDAMELRRAGYASRKSAEADQRRRKQTVKVTVVNLQDWHVRQFGSGAA